jgi:hypothetical protein
MNAIVERGIEGRDLGWLDPEIRPARPSVPSGKHAAGGALQVLQGEVRPS